MFVSRIGIEYVLIMQQKMLNDIKLQVRKCACDRTSHNRVSVDAAVDFTTASTVEEYNSLLEKLADKDFRRLFVSSYGSNMELYNPSFFIILCVCLTCF